MRRKRPHSAGSWQEMRGSARMSQGGERMQRLPRRAPGGSASQLREPRQPFGSRSHIQAATPKIALDSARQAAGRLDWLWVAATPRRPSTPSSTGGGTPEDAVLLGADHAGVIVRDGWAPYRRFTQASHQTCRAPRRRHPQSLWRQLLPTGRCRTANPGIRRSDRPATATRSTRPPGTPTPRTFPHRRT